MNSKTDESGLDFERIVFFSDAVFAIAITLLAIDIRLPGGIEIRDSAALVQSLVHTWPELLSYLLSFFVIGSYWIAHHSMFRIIRGFDQGLIWLNLLFLLFIAISPFPTRIVGEYGDLPAAQVFYASGVAATGLVKHVLWRYAAKGGRLLKPEISPVTVRRFTIRGLVIPVIFVASIPLAFYPIFSIFVLWMASPPIYYLIDRALRRDTSETENL